MRSLSGPRPERSQIKEELVMSTDALAVMIEQLRDFDSALLANTLGYIDPTPAHEIYMSGDIASVTPALGPTVGVAVTCQLDTSTPGGEAIVDPYWKQLEQIEAMRVPVVWVVETVGSRPDHECVMGDGMAKTLYSVGCYGAVTNGRVRDVEGMLATPFAVYCRGTAIHHCTLRFTAVDGPVQVGGLTVLPGDLIHASTEGVIRIPPASVGALIEKAPLMRAFEHEAHCLLRRTDVPVREKRPQVGELLGKYGFGQE
jgi:regulator of RNase E activity RraA